MNKLRSKAFLPLNRLLASSLLLTLLLSVLIHFITFGFFFGRPVAEVQEIVEFDLLEPVERRQIVETEESLDRRVPKKTKYLGKRNQSVKKETKSENISPFRAGKKAQLRVLDLKQLVPSTVGNFMSVKKRKRLAQPSASNDYLKKVKKGNSTLLNTKEFIYYTYYHRIRKRLESSWSSELRGAIFRYIKSERRFLTDASYTTRLSVFLDRHGRIKAIKLLRGSGAIDLDEAAIEAFNRAGPFPNPPRGLIERGGLIRIYWDFVVQS